MRRRKIFNFLVMWIETDVFIRKFIKRIEISVNIWNFTEWVEIILIIQIVRTESRLTIRNTV